MEKEMTSALILAGGKSSRMNYENKAYLKWRGKFLIEHIVGEVEKVSHEILISQPRKDEIHFPQYKVVYDKGESHGPISGIEAALLQCRHEVLLVTACDMPRMRAELFEILLTFAARKKEYDAIVPVVGKKRQPLAAVYRNRILPAVKKQIEEEKRYSMNRLLDKLNVFYVDEEKIKKMGIENPQILFSNINTRMEYEELVKFR